MNSLVDPPFAKDPPVKVNVNAKTLGLVLLILGALGILLDALALIGILGFCGSYSIYGGCNLPVLWLLGDLLGLAALIVGTIGAYRMYQLNPEGKQWVIYGLLLGIVGAVVTLIGNYAAYSGLIGDRRRRRGDLRSHHRPDHLRRHLLPGRGEPLPWRGAAVAADGDLVERGRPLGSASSTAERVATAAPLVRRGRTPAPACTAGRLAPGDRSPQTVGGGGGVVPPP